MKSVHKNKESMSMQALRFVRPPRMPLKHVGLRFGDSKARQQCSRTWWHTTQPSAVVREKENGRELWAFWKKSSKQPCGQMWSVTAPPSVPMRRVGSGKGRWVCLKIWVKLGYYQMSSSTAQRSVRVHELENGSMQWACWKRCLAHPCRSM